ncbi:membrane protease YdiL (CAAX protease family) [Parabacteroides sp. PF5-5]|uniref:CPBP family intramembrane glutamic endopeptidase n=1 Tax=unclassified Parabacteroides TaxID=2649774 RepID=UPI0024740C6C|nr:MULTISPECIES: CPBP family intramembrane glutamic endopeptidase [unclassified Parabacteroides]MDH6305025.1 membrane protease YdiL (CAAX protease family) [Parabacteroides sp. PH5-39]MDH6315890.1 membrane protease YdiL (CAAX protease family) [Parabacteroides sp. PF5-13]MDH6319547.1 membrane protease YdiL (CAAX protease family) [Parabacteroides sp. PH5-13]MDH6323278.1 membrane protease YdiL (CAAX protease family) [Parabacteroides sp. PH5-8]MDH6327214.1 membrane protease YdiL (CAAX protease fami
MKLKGVYASKPAIFQLFLLLALVLLGSILSAITGVALSGNLSGYTQNPNTLRWVQFFSAIFTFLLPSLGVAWMCSHRPERYLSIRHFPNLKILLLTFASMLLVSPTITLAGLLNQSIKLPAFLGPLEQWMKEMETAAEALTELIMAGEGWVTLLFNLVVIAVIAGVTEEFFFRGAVQRIVGRWVANHHAVIWIVAFFFSAIHLQFYGFIPRMLLGAYFGYLLYWSKNIWIPVFAHFVNNAVAVIGMSNSRLKESEYISGEIPEGGIFPFAISALITLGLFYLCINQLYKSFKKD